MRLHPPGPEGEPIELRTQATIPSASKVDRWLEREKVKKRMCACGCGRPIELVRRHYWTGIPTYRSDCRHRAMQAKRASVTGEEYINAAQLARKLGVGRTTIGRWIRQGKLPEPKRGISGMLLFPKDFQMPSEM